MSVDADAGGRSSPGQARSTRTSPDPEFLPTEADPPRARADVAWTVPPLRARGVALLLGGWIGLSVVTTVLGLGIVEWWVGSDPGEADADVNRWWAERRTPWLNEFAALGSAFSDTVTIVVLGLVLIPLCVWWFGRWHEAALIVGVMVIETATYLVVSRIVTRERPPVEQISGPINDHSFPSGHVAAAMVFYGALAVIVTWHSVKPWAHSTLTLIVVVVPLWVAWSRMYVGAHHVSDFTGSLVIGFGVLAVVSRSLRSDDEIAPPDAIVVDRDAGDRQDR